MINSTKYKYAKTFLLYLPHNYNNICVRGRLLNEIILNIMSLTGLIGRETQVCDVIKVINRDKICRYIYNNLYKYNVTLINFSRISHENIPGFCLLSSSILASTSGVATLGFDPPITPGLIDPVSWAKHDV